MNDLSQALTLQIVNEDVAFVAQDSAMTTLIVDLQHETGHSMYKLLMQLNTLVLAQRTYIHELLQKYRAYRVNNVNEVTKLMIKNRISFLMDKSTHLTEIRNDMSVLQRMLHSNAVY